MEISVVLATYNRLPKLEKCLGSLLNQDSVKDYEVVIVDNGSTDNTVEYLKDLAKKSKKLKLLEHGLGNVGPAKARNLGTKAAKSAIVAFTDDDCIPPKNWLKTILEAFEDPNIDSVGGYLEAEDSILRSNIFAKYESYNERKNYNVADEPYISTKVDELPFQTNNIAYRRKVLNDLSGFDETYGLIPGEDGNLKERALKKNYTFRYLPLQVTHIQDYSLKRFWRQQISRGVSVMEYRKRHDMSIPSKVVVIAYFLATPIKALATFAYSRGNWSIVIAEFIAQIARNVGRLKYQRN